MEKKNKRGIAMAGVIVALLLVAFMVLDYSLIWTKRSAIYYGKQLLVEEFVKPPAGINGQGFCLWMQKKPMEYGEYMIPFVCRTE
ncbi:MAG: hypothetical protein SO147_09990 [Clostridia bacterium]|nr:hypothetical protein [Clostridia bacterium]